MAYLAAINLKELHYKLSNNIPLTPEEHRYVAEDYMTYGERSQFWKYLRAPESRIIPVTPADIIAKTGEGLKQIFNWSQPIVTIAVVTAIIVLAKTYLPQRR